MSSWLPLSSGLVEAGLGVQRQFRVEGADRRTPDGDRLPHGGDGPVTGNAELHAGNSENRAATAAWSAGNVLGPDHQPGRPGGQFRHATAPPSGSSTSPSRRGTAPGPQRTATRPAAARPPSSDEGRTAGRCRNRAHVFRPDQCCQASEPNTWTGTPSASAASNTEASSGHHDAGADGSTAARAGGPAGSRRRRTPWTPIRRLSGRAGRAADRQRAFAGGRRATTSGRPRRRHPSTAARSSEISGVRSHRSQSRPARSSRAGTRQVGPADQVSRRTRSETARASVRPWRSSPAARRRSPEAGAARALARQAAGGRPPTTPRWHPCAQVVVHSRREHRRGGAQLRSPLQRILVTRAMDGRFITRISASGRA